MDTRAADGLGLPLATVMVLNLRKMTVLMELLLMLTVQIRANDRPSVPMIVMAS